MSGQSELQTARYGARPQSLPDAGAAPSMSVAGGQTSDWKTRKKYTLKKKKKFPKKILLTKIFAFRDTVLPYCQCLLLLTNISKLLLLNISVSEYRKIVYQWPGQFMGLRAKISFSTSKENMFSL